MPEQNLIDVRILVNGQSLQEFPDTDGQYTGNENVVCYVQAETGQAFEVQVKWLSGYSLRHAPFLRAELKVDGHDTIACYSIKATKLRLKKGSLSKDFKKTFASVIAKNELEQWKRYTFTFGALGLMDTLPAENSPKLRSISKLGTIEVSIFRADGTERLAPYISSRRLPQVVDQVSETILKGKPMKSIVKFEMSTTNAVAPAPRLYDYEPMPGLAGKETKFIFKYRNKNILQYLGCIPRSPSPEPDHALIAARTEEMFKAQKQAMRQANLEILRLRQELDRQPHQPRDGNIALANNSTMPVLEPAATETTRSTAKLRTPLRLGRRRDQHDDDDLEMIASPPKRAAVLVDLTEDD